MPQVLNVYPLDIHTEIRFSLTELNLLADFLDKCEYQGDLSDPENNEHHEYVMKKFFPFLNQLTDDLMKGIPDGIRPDSEGSELQGFDEEVSG